MERAASQTAADPLALRRATQPVAPARERLLPVVSALAPLLPDGALRRGTVVATAGPAATSLGVALAAGPSAAGSWVGVLGLPALGLLAAAQAGIDLARLLLVAAPDPGEWAAITAALLDGVDVALVGMPRTLRPADARRLQSRVRDRGGVLVVVAEPGPPALTVDLTLTAGGGWVGLEAGAGHLRGRRVEVVAVGRGAASRPRRAGLWLPDPAGEPAPGGAEVVPLRTALA